MSDVITAARATSRWSWAALGAAVAAVAAVVAVQVAALSARPAGPDGAIRWLLLTTPVCLGALGVSLTALLVVRSRRERTTVAALALGVSVVLTAVVVLIDVGEVWAATMYGFR